MKIHRLLSYENRLNKFLNEIPAQHRTNYIARTEKCGTEVVDFSVNNELVTMQLTEVLHLWAIHDSIHFLTGLSTNPTDEIKIARIELEFDCGWSSLDKYHNEYRSGYNVYSSDKYQSNLDYTIPKILNMRKILKTAKNIESYYNRKSIERRASYR